MPHNVIKHARISKNYQETFIVTSEVLHCLKIT
jgi:hypothetical protein